MPHSLSIPRLIGALTSASVTSRVLVAYFSFSTFIFFQYIYISFPHVINDGENPLFTEPQKVFRQYVIFFFLLFCSRAAHTV